MRRSSTSTPPGPVTYTTLRVSESRPNLRMCSSASVMVQAGFTAT